MVFKKYLCYVKHIKKLLDEVKVMKLVLANDNLVGEVLANPIYTENGMMFVNKGNKISKTVISRLKKMGITTIYVEDDNDEINLQEVLPTPFKLLSLKLLKEVFAEIKNKDYINESKVFDIVQDIMKNINLSENAALVNNLAPNDDLSKLAMHSLNVTILTLMVCIHKRFDDKKLLKIGVAALLHDIGKLYVDGNEHVIRGRDLIKKNSAFTSTTFMAVYYLYEREDGSGPFGILGEKIHEFTKILSICNEYINSINGDELMLPHVAMEKISAEAVSKFDKDIYADFAQSLYCYPNGLQVNLNNGQEGIVVMQNSGFTTRPILGIKTNEGYKFCNLVEPENLTLFIEKVML